MAGVFVGHGVRQSGYLLATTHWLRWVRAHPSYREDFWSYESSIAVEGSFAMGGIIRTSDGNQFQMRWGKAKKFVEMYHLIQQAFAYDSDGSGDSADTETAVLPPLVQASRAACWNAQGGAPVGRGVHDSKNPAPVELSYRSVGPQLVALLFFRPTSVLGGRGVPLGNGTIAPRNI